MQPINSHLDNYLVEDIISTSTRIIASNKILTASKEKKRLDNSINAYIKEFKKIKHDPQDIIAMETMCVLLEKASFAKADNDFERCNNQLVENMEAFLAASLVKDKEKYLEKIQASMADPKILPKTDSFLNVVDKRVKQLGVAFNSLDASPARKKFFLVRQENLRLAKKLYIELQKEALGLDTKKQSQGLRR